MSHEPIKTVEQRLKNITYRGAKITVSTEEFIAHVEEIAELRAAYESLQKEKTKIEDELDEYKEHHEELTEHYRALQFLESEFRKENESLNAEVFRLKNELITSLKDWHDLNANNSALQKENAELKEQIALFVGVETAAMGRCEKSVCMELAEANAAQAKRIVDLEEKEQALNDVLELMGTKPEHFNCLFSDVDTVMKQASMNGAKRIADQAKEIESLRKQVEALEQSQLNEVINLRTRNAQLQAKMDQFAEVLKRHHQIAPFDLVNRLVTILLSAPEYQEPTKDE